MEIGRGRDLDARGAVIAIGVALGLIVVVLELSGSNGWHIAHLLNTAVAVVVFTALGSAGVALAYWQPRFAFFGLVAATLSLLAGGSTIALDWSGRPSFFGLSFDGTAGRVILVTHLLAISSAAACALLATVRTWEDNATRLVRAVAVGGLAVLVGLTILAVVDRGLDISLKLYAIAATVFVVATAVLLILRLLPDEAELPLSS